MRKIPLMLLLVTISGAAYAQQGLRRIATDAVTTDSGVPLSGTAIVYHQLTWNTSGTVSTCTVALDSSTDGITWSAGGAIAGQTCTTNGQSVITNANVNYVRIHVTAISGGGTVTITWSGYTATQGVPITTVAGLVNYVSAKLAVVTDGNSATDCTTGGGSTVVTCQYGGSSWAAVSGAGSMVYPVAGIANSTGAAWGTSYGVSGTGNVCLTTSCAMTTPTLGVASATSVNKVAITAPATGSTLTIADGKTLTVSNTMTLAGTDSSTYTFPGASATMSYTVASGTSALGTGAITSATCATVVTGTATGAATTDVVSWSPNADWSAITGYAPVTTGSLIIYAYPTLNTVNFKVCNPTASSITPGAASVNWRVTR